MSITKEIFFTVVATVISINAFCQVSTLSKKGILVFNKPSFKHCAILMQDTTLSGNRFDTWFDMVRNKEFSINPRKTFQYPAFIVDCCLFSEVEERLLTTDSSVSFSNYSNENLQANIARYVRLYIGYIDSLGRKNVVVQFVTFNEYKRAQHLYRDELFLIVNQKKVRFAIIKI